MAPGRFIYILIYIIMLDIYKNIFLYGIAGRDWPPKTLVPTPVLVRISMIFNLEPSKLIPINGNQVVNPGTNVFSG